MSAEGKGLVERLRAWKDLAGWADGGWNLPPHATSALDRCTGQAADALESLQRQVTELEKVPRGSFVRKSNAKEGYYVTTEFHNKALADLQSQLAEARAERDKTKGIADTIAADAQELTAQAEEDAVRVHYLEAENERLKRDAGRLNDIATNACFHYWGCMGECSEFRKAMALLARACNYYSEPASEAAIDAALSDGARNEPT